MFHSTCNTTRSLLNIQRQCSWSFSMLFRLRHSLISTSWEKKDFKSARIITYFTSSLFGAVVVMVTIIS